ncbi:MAG: ATP-binding protein [Anaerolineales bacterium]
MVADAHALDTIELKEQVRLLARIVEVSLKLNSTLDHAPLLQHIIDAAADLLDSEAASLLLYNDVKQELRFSAATGSDPAELAKIPVPLDGSIAGEVFRGGKAIIQNDVASDPRHFDEVGEEVKFVTRSLLAVPMYSKDRVIGVLEALNKRSDHKFAEADSRILQILGSQAAVAIENARLIDSVQKAYDELGKLDKMKSDFIALASHELRTPLGVILGYASFLREEAEGEAGEYARIVLDSAVHMRKLIEDLTNLRFLEVGDMTLTPGKLDLRDLMHEARTDLAALSDAKSQTLTIEIPDEPLLVDVDRSKILVVLTNLLTNAIRFTPDRGHITVRAFAHGREAWVQVVDNGKGIPEKELDKIFKRFYQVEEHLVRKEGGLGLGLSIVRGTVKLHGGRVWAESAGKDQGSTFTFTLPLSVRPSG